MTSSDIHKKAMLEALEKSLGVVTAACKAVDISRETHYRWMREDAEYKAAVEELSDVEAWVCGTPRGRRIFGQAISN
jgi:hypothetical protein